MPDQQGNVMVEYLVAVVVFVLVVMTGTGAEPGILHAMPEAFSHMNERFGRMVAVMDEAP